MEARGLSYPDAPLPQVVGAVRAVRHERVVEELLKEGAKAQMEVSAMLKGFFKVGR